MPSFTIRDGSRADIDGLDRLEADAFQGDRLSPRSFSRFVGSSSAHLRVVQMGDAVPGYHVVLTRSGAHVARLYSIAVDAAYRGRGIAAALLADAEAESRRAGCDVLRLEVRADNAAGIHLYETHGYRPIGRIAGYYSDGADALRYEKRLVHGAGGFERGRPSGTTLSGPRGRRRAPRRGLAALPTLHPPEGF